MNINEQEKGQAVVFSIDGRLDSNTSEAFEKELMGKIDEGKKHLVVDFTDLEYISSAGLRVLLMAAKRLKSESGGFALCGLKDHIREVFEISGFLPILTVVDDMDAAVAAVST